MSLVVGAKFCGSCNPEIDLEALWQELEREAQARGVELVPAARAASPPDGVVLLCGCPRACLDRPEVRALAPRSLLVAGPAVDLRPTPERSLAHAILDAVEAWRPGP